MSTIKCLEGAIDILNRAGDDTLPTELRDEIVRGLKAVLKSAGEDDAVALARMKAAMKSTELDAKAAQYAKLHQDTKDVELAELFLSTGDPVEAAIRLRQAVDPLPGNRGGDRQAFLTRTRGETRDLQGRLAEALSYVQHKGVYLRASDGDRDLRRALMGLDTDDPKAKELAKVIKETFEPYIDRLREAGVWVRKRDNWWMRDYDFARIQADRAKFEDLMRQGLDRANHPDPDATIAKMIQSLSEADTVGSKQVGIGMRRKLEFNDPEIEFQVQMEFGRGTLGTQLIRLADVLPQETIAAEMFGPMWRSKIPELANRIAVEGGVDPDLTRTFPLGRAARNLRHAIAIMNSQTSDLSRAANFTPNNVMAAAQNYVSFSFLGKTALWQVTIDPVIGMLSAPMVQGNIFRRVTRQLGALAKLATNPEVRQQMKYLGVWKDTIAMQGNSRLPYLMDPATQFNLGPSKARTFGERMLNNSTQLATLTQRATFSHFLENWNRSGHMMATLSALGDTFGRSWDDLPAKLRKWDFESNGLTKADWESIRKTPLTELGIPDLNNLRQRNPRVHSRLMGMLHREAELGIVRSDISDRVVLTIGTTPGTGASTLASTITQFWSWNMAMFRGPMMRAWHRGGTSGLIGFSASLVIATAMGMQFRAMASGQPLWDMENPKFWWRAFIMSGVLSPVGQPATDAIGSSGRTGLMGAVPGTAAQISNLALGGATDLWDGEVEKAALKGAKITHRAIPNWWQIEWLVSNTMEEITWQLDPESARARDRALRNQGRVED